MTIPSYFLFRKNGVSKYSLFLKGITIALVGILIFADQNYAYGREFTFINNYGQTIWVAGTNSPGMPVTMDPAASGFKLVNGAQAKFSIPNEWDGRFWGRTGCNFPSDSDYNSSKPVGCDTGDCNKQERCQVTGALPASLAEFNLVGNPDYFDVSLVDGYNLPLTVTPSTIASTVTMQNSQAGSCAIPGCVKDLNSSCPDALQVKLNGVVVACKSACTAFGDPKYCCTESFNTPDKCPPTDYSKIFKDACPTSYSYAYDDLSSTFGCSGNTNYTITFGKADSQASTSISPVGSPSNGTNQCLTPDSSGAATMGYCNNVPTPTPTPSNPNPTTPAQDNNKNSGQVYQFTRVSVSANDKNIFTISSVATKQCMQAASQVSTPVQFVKCVTGNKQQLFSIVMTTPGIGSTASNQYEIQPFTDQTLCFGLITGPSGAAAQLFQVQRCNITDRLQKFSIPALANYIN